MIIKLGKNNRDTISFYNFCLKNLYINTFCERDSNEKIKRVSSRFHQTIFLEEGVFKTVEAYRKNKFQSGIDWYFDATTDRIIRRWCREHRDVRCPNKLRFRDYLGNASKHDWVTYHLIRGKGTFEEKFLRRCLSLRNKINSFIGRFWNA